MTYHPLDYWNGFSCEDGHMAHGIEAVIRYTIGYVKFHVKKKMEFLEGRR